MLKYVGSEKKEKGTKRKHFDFYNQSNLEKKKSTHQSFPEIKHIYFVLADKEPGHSHWKRSQWN